MKNIIKLSFVVIALVFTLASCEDWLENEPVTSLNYSLSLGDFAGLNQSTIGAYTDLYNADYYGASFPIVSDIKCNNAKSSPSNSGRYQFDYNWIQNASQTIYFMDNAYDVITSSCQVLDAIEAYEIPAGVEQDEVNHLRGECLFLRALAHHDLVRMYSQPFTYQPDGLGMPVILHMENGSPARNTTREVYTQILADLTEAETMFADADFMENHRNAAQNIRGFASLEAVQALKARVYLYMGNYQEAANYANTVISSGVFTLYTASNYTTVWGTNAASEVIFEVYGDMNQTNAPYWSEIGYLYDGNGSYGDVCASTELMSLFERSDVRLQLFGEDMEDYYWPNKYPGKSGDSRSNNIPVLRLSEMYLIRAEAILGGASIAGATALGDINMIRKNRGASELTAVTIDDIFDERRRELCFEGHLFFDHKRLQRPLDRPDEDSRITGTEDVEFPSHLWAMPIPQGEMEANENMVQNDGY